MIFNSQKLVNFRKTHEMLELSEKLRICKFRKTDDEILNEV